MWTCRFSPARPPAECCAPTVGLDPVLDAERIAAVAKALLRIRSASALLDVLRRSDEPVCQCEFVALFDIGQSLLSHHVRKLLAAGLVEVERRHRWADYRVPRGPEGVDRMADLTTASADREIREAVRARYAET